MEHSEWDKYLVSYPSLSEEDFSKEIVRHEEFYSSSFDCSDGFCHQERIARYMSYFTLYDSLLVVHEMGTGKTGVAIALMDALKEQQNVERILFLCNNSTIEQNFYTEVKKYSRYFRKVWQNMSRDLPEEKKNSRWNSVFLSQKLISRTYQKFYKEIETVSDENLLSQYQNTLIICDEAHHLNFQHRKEMSLAEKKQGEKIYEQIYRLFHVLGKHKKALVMTGTPIRDQPEEIVLLFNLILASSSNPLPVDQEFLETFLKVQRQVDIPILRQQPPSSEEQNVQQEESIRTIQLPIYEWRDSSEKQLFEILKGRISFLRQQLTRVQIKYEGEIFSPMEHLRLRPNFMSPFQMDAYLSVIPGGGSEGGVDNGESGDSSSTEVSDYTLLYQASLFVFPWYRGSENEEEKVEALVGEQGFSKFIDFKLNLSALSAMSGENRRGRKKKFSMVFRWKEEDPKIKNPIWPPSIWKQLISVDTSIPAKIAILRTYSTIYADFLESFFGNVQQLCYVYSEWVRGSGMMVLALILKTFFGFTMITRASQIEKDKERTSGFRFLFINDLFHIRDSEVQQLLSYFNHRDNARGKYCQILLSTGKTKEGISVMNIQQIHILTPSWNFADISQAIARGLRKNSHTALMEQGMDVEDLTVRVFLHTALIPFPSPSEEQQEQEQLSQKEKEEYLFLSIDFQRYARSEIKDRNARLIYRFLTKSAWDCPWSKSINQIKNPEEDSSRDCDYQKCAYQCYGEDKLPLESQRVDASWLELYGEQPRQLLLSPLFSILQACSGIASFSDLQYALQKKVSFPVTTLLLYQIIEDACQYRIPFSNFDGRIYYLSFQNQMVQLVDHPMMSFGFSFPESRLSLPVSTCRLEWTVQDYLDFYRNNPEKVDEWISEFIFLMENMTTDRKSLVSLFQLWNDNILSLTMVVKKVVEKMENSPEDLEELYWTLLKMMREEYPNLLNWVSKDESLESLESIESIDSLKRWEDVLKLVLPTTQEEYDVKKKIWTSTIKKDKEKKEEIIIIKKPTKQVVPGTPEFERLIINNKIGFYAILKDENAFLIRDVRNKDLFLPSSSTTTKIRNKRNIPSGLYCGSFKVQCIIYILWLFLQQDPSIGEEIDGILRKRYEKKLGMIEPTLANIEKMKKLAWFSKLTATTTSPALFTPEELEENIKEIYRLGLLKRDVDICPLLRKLFIKFNLSI